jgi:hypothetical protein
MAQFLIPIRLTVMLAGHPLLGRSDAGWGDGRVSRRGSYVPGRDDRAGRPHATALWFGWDGTCLWLYSIIGSRRWADLQKDPRISVQADAGHHYLELRGVKIRGTIEVVGDVPRTAEPNGELAPVELQFAGKYLGGEMLRDGRHAWLRVTPRKITSWDFRKLPG